jgi:hypothetical protein
MAAPTRRPSIFLARAAGGWPFASNKGPQDAARTSDSIESRAVLKPWLFDWSTVDDARAECAIAHPAQRVAHLYYCLYRSTTEGGRTLASFGSWPNSRRASRCRSKSQH